jgi:hypothetical protein
MLVLIRRTSDCPALTGGERFLAYKCIPAFCGMLQGMDDGHSQRKGRGSTRGKIVKEPTCECTRPSTEVHCNVCGYVTVGRIRKQCPRHPMVSVFTTGFLFFLGSFAKLREATNAFVMSVLSVRPPARPPAWNNLVSTGRIFLKFYISVFFQNMSKNCKSY